jgi:hypothetical protein
VGRQVPRRLPLCAGCTRDHVRPARLIAAVPNACPAHVGRVGIGPTARPLGADSLRISFDEEFVDALVALADADLYAARHPGVAPLEGVKQRGAHQPCAPVTEILEGEGVEGDPVGEALVGEGLWTIRSDGRTPWNEP